MIRNKVFYSLPAEATGLSKASLIVKKNRITLNPSETTGQQEDIPNRQPMNYNTYSIVANQGLHLAKTLNPQTTTKIQYNIPEISYKTVDYKTDYMLPQARSTFAFNSF